MDGPRDDKGKMILVTGAGGFIGTALVGELARRNTSFRPVSRTGRDGHFPIRDIGPDTDWTAALRGVDAVVHLASNAHAPDQAPAPSEEATLNLARQAARAGAKRFVFISSVKVNGEATELGRPFTADDPPDPQDAYAQAKLETERGLFALSRQTGLQVTVLRPPLVYGPGVKANFAAMMEWANRGIPFPLRAFGNRRSFVYVGNLVDLVILCVSHPNAAGQVFLVSDGEDLSTAELFRRIARALGRSSWIMPVPAPLLTFAATAIGQRTVANRLVGSLQVDISKTRQFLGWTPRTSVDEGLRQTALCFQQAELALDPIARSA
jgi:UDP-glucose 4-epimerase